MPGAEAAGWRSVLAAPTAVPPHCPALHGPTELLTRLRRALAHEEGRPYAGSAGWGVRLERFGALRARNGIEPGRLG